MQAASESSRMFVDALYSELLRRGVNYFLRDSQLEAEEDDAAEYSTELTVSLVEGGYEIAWLGRRFRLRPPGGALSPDQKRLLKSIGLVLGTRYQLLQQQATAVQSFRLFRGQPEDRYVSAFLERGPHEDAHSAASTPDRISSVIDVLRVSALTTYENRRIVTGVLLFGPLPDSCHDEPETPDGALPYTSELTAVRSFHRLSDGLQSMALVNRDGLLAELVDVHKWAKPYAQLELPVPSAARYEAHSRATLCGGHVCLVLTPNGEIKIFSQGAQTFRFIDGRWHLTDAVEKYRQWRELLGDERLAECLYGVALNMVEERRGGLFVVLDDPMTVGELVVPSDLVDAPLPERPARMGQSKEHLHYLLRQRRVVDLPSSVVETVARIDGAMVLDRDSRVLAFGAILRHTFGGYSPDQAAEGSRTTAALGASRLGKVLKISEDGLMAFYSGGRLIWEI